MLKTTNGFARSAKIVRLLRFLVECDGALNTSLDVRAKQRLCYQRRPLNLRLSLAVSPHVTSNVMWLPLNMLLAKDKESDEIDYLAEVKEFHRQFVEPLKGKPKGCWDFEIRSLEKSFGFELPVAYKQYLAWMGKDYNGVFVGCDWFISNVEENTALVPELLEENNISFVLPKNYLCFFSHQGYIAAWFELPKLSDNPACWFYHEGMNLKEPIIEGTFTDILLKDMRGLAENLPHIYKRAT